MKWNLRLAAAHPGIWTVSEMQRMLAARGLAVSVGKMSALWSGSPERTGGRHRAVGDGGAARPARPGGTPSSTEIRFEGLFILTWFSSPGTGAAPGRR
jgi:hypothetical protein